MFDCLRCLSRNIFGIGGSYLISSSLQLWQISSRILLDLLKFIFIWKINHLLKIKIGISDYPSQMWKINKKIVSYFPCIFLLEEDCENFVWNINLWSGLTPQSQSMPPVSHPVSARIATAIIPDESVTELLEQLRLVLGVAQSPSAREEELEVWLAAMLLLLVSDWSLTCVRGALLVKPCRQAYRH